MNRKFQSAFHARAHVGGCGARAHVQLYGKFLGSNPAEESPATIKDSSLHFGFDSTTKLAIKRPLRFVSTIRHRMWSLRVT